MNKQSSPRKVSFCLTRHGLLGCAFLVALCLSFLPGLAHAASGIDKITVTPVAPFHFCERAVAFRIGYALQAGSFSTPHQPSFETRKANADLILAKVVEAVLEREYHAKGKGLDEWNVTTPVTYQSILDLIARTDLMTPRWRPDNQYALSMYLGQAGTDSFLQCSRLDIILDYETTQGGQYGTDANPILLQLNNNGQPDLATVLFTSAR